MSDCQGSLSEDEYDRPPVAPAPKRRGRPPGSATKAKTHSTGAAHFHANQPDSQGAASAGLVSRKFESLGFAPTAVSSVTTSLKAAPDKACPEAAAAAAAVREKLKPLDFAAMGTSARTLFILLRDVSPSERPFEEQFCEAGNAIAPELARDRLAANIVDVVLLHGAEDLKVVSVGHAKDFRMPAWTEYGRATHGRPWFLKLPGVIQGYRDHLADVGLDVANVYVVFAGDFKFGDDFVDALREFRAVQEADPTLVVIPAGHGEWVPEVAAEVSVRVKPVDLNNLKIRDFIKLVANSVREVSYSRPENRADYIAQLNNLRG